MWTGVHISPYKSPQKVNCRADFRYFPQTKYGLMWTAVHISPYKSLQKVNCRADFRVFPHKIWTDMDSVHISPYKSPQKVNCRAPQSTFYHLPQKNVPVHIFGLTPLGNILMDQCGLFPKAPPIFVLSQ